MRGLHHRVGVQEEVFQFGQCFPSFMGIPLLYERTPSQSWSSRRSISVRTVFPFFYGYPSSLGEDSITELEFKKKYFSSDSVSLLLWVSLFFMRGLHHRVGVQEEVFQFGQCFPRSEEHTSELQSPDH